MKCPRCGEAGRGPYVKIVRGNPYVYFAHCTGHSRARWCYLPRERLLNPAFFRRGRFLYVRELLRLIEGIWRRVGIDVTAEGIYIFGSQVRGAYNEGSDLDVWVQIKPKSDDDIYAVPVALTKTRRMVAPPRDVPRATLQGVDVEVVCSTQKPKPPYFDVLEQRLVLIDE